MFTATVEVAEAARSQPVMVIGLDDASDSHWIKRSLDFAVHGLSKDSPELVGKLAEGLFAEAVRQLKYGTVSAA